MRYRVTLTNELEGSEVISNPDGWNNIKLKLSRHPKYHSLIEQIDVPIIFYGGNGVIDGGYHYIKRVIETQGINAIITINIGISEDEGANYELFFEGNLELSDKEEYSEGSLFYKLQCPIIQKSLWSNFVNRIETPVDLLSDTDLDGNDTQVPESIELTLLPQELQQRFSGELSPGRAFSIDPSGELAVNDYIQLDFGDITLLDEIAEKFDIPVSITADPAPLLEIKYGGLYQIQCAVEMSFRFEGFGVGCTGPSILSSDPTSGSHPAGNIEVYFRINNGTAILLNETNYIGTPDGDSTLYTYTGSHRLKVGDQLYFYAKVVSLLSPTDDAFNLLIWGTDNGTVLIARPDQVSIGGGGQCVVDTTQLEEQDFGDTAPSGNIKTSYLRVTANTTFEETTTDALLIHDAAKSIVHRITGIPNNSFYSEILGGITHGYDFDGCDYKYALMKGLHVRGYTFADKPFFMSFKDFWEGADPIFNLGLGYEEKPPIGEEYLAAFTIGFTLGFES